MNTLIVLSTLIAAATAKSVVCHACLNNICHRRVTVFEARQFSGQLAVDTTSNLLYFHYQNKSKDYTGVFDLDEIRFSVLPKVDFTFGHAVDQATRELYMSADRGVYKYDPVKNHTELLGLQDKTVWHLQYHNTLYYSEFRKKGLNTFANKRSESIPALSKYDIDDFIIDRQGDIYFLSNFATYLLKNGAKKAAMFEDEIYFLSVDNNFDAYFIQPYTKAIYKINYRTHRLEEIGALEKGSIVKLVFDANNNMIYLDGAAQRLYYLMPNYHKCSVITRRIGKNIRKILSIAP